MKEKRENKICPILSIGRERLEECLGEHCALWEIITGNCGLMAIGYLMALSNEKSKDVQSWSPDILL